MPSAQRAISGRSGKLVAAGMLEGCRGRLTFGRRYRSALTYEAESGTGAHRRRRLPTGSRIPPHAEAFGQGEQPRSGVDGTGTGHFGERISLLLLHPGLGSGSHGRGGTERVT